jgi:hypothetical protein
VGATVKILGRDWPLSMSVAALRRIGTARGIPGVNPKKIIEALDPEDFGSVALFIHAMIPTKQKAWEALTSEPYAPAPSIEEVEEAVSTSNVREVMRAVGAALGIEGEDEPVEEADEPGPPGAPSH